VISSKHTFATVAVVAVVVFLGVWATPLTAKSAQSAGVASATNSSPSGDDLPVPPIVSIRGLVRDIACAVQNPKAEAREFNLQCAKACALAGSPLIVQTDDGTLYIPISNTIPDTDQRPRLMPFVGKYVEVRGRVYERRGTRAITLEAIKELPDVKLKIE
jgi:DNA/RNA endonuclease YhcR with UshA esterase domain